MKKVLYCSFFFSTFSFFSNAQSATSVYENIDKSKFKGGITVHTGVIVPSLVGHKITDKFLIQNTELLGLKIRAKYLKSPRNVPSGTILKQVPAAESEIMTPAFIDVEVAK